MELAGHVARLSEDRRRLVEDMVLKIRNPDLVDIAQQIAALSPTQERKLGDLVLEIRDIDQAATSEAHVFDLT